MNRDPTILYLEVQTYLEIVVSAAHHPFISSLVSVAGERLRAKLPNRADASHIGYYLSVNANCFFIYFSVERIATLPASWGSTRNKDDNLGSASTSAGERYVR
jgi:hypothetical protein